MNITHLGVICGDYIGCKGITPVGDIKALPTKRKENHGIWTNYGLVQVHYSVNLTFHAAEFYKRC